MSAPDFNAIAADAGVDKEKEHERAELPLRVQIMTKLEKARGKRMSAELLLAELACEPASLRQAISREVKQQYPRFRRDGRYDVVLASGFSKPRDIDWDTLKLRPIKRAALMPKPMRGNLGPEAGIEDSGFFVVAAPPDSYKTALLVNIAEENARAGATVQFVNHEANDHRIVRLFAQRETGTVLSSKDALEVCRTTDWIRRIKLRTTQQQQLEELKLEGDVFVWDYLSSTFLRADGLVSQGSHYSQYVQLLGDRICDKGVPLFTAVQKHWGDNGGVKSTWFERATMCLVVEDIERDDDYDLVTYNVVKNKESGVHDYLDVMYDNAIGSILSATPLTRRAYKAREDLKKKQAKEDAKTQMDAEESAQANRRQERSALRVVNGKLDYAMEKL
jgi:hypothetical protein